MEEQLLQFIWYRKLFDATNLFTTSGDPLEILHAGTPNDDQGPDFLHCRICIGDQWWAGHVEIHIRSSSWYMHLHDRDTHYNNVILHVVWEEDRPAITHDGYRIPCLELSGRVEHDLLQRYRHLMNNQEWVPCASALDAIHPLIKSSWLDRMMAERLEDKASVIHRLLDRTAHHWEEVCYILLARQTGAPANREAMEELGLRMPLTLLRKHKDRPDQIEALLFGAAGMLGKEMNEPYCAHLFKEFEFLRKKYKLQPMPSLQWKFLRMRPQHFPTIRIAQLAAIVIKTDYFISMLEQGMTSREWIDHFMVTPGHSFWETHFHFAASTAKSNKRLGADTAASLVINVIAPFMFIYGKHQGNANMKARAISLLEELPAERNAITEGWKSCGWSGANAAATQALFHLKRSYCDQRRCLHCAIGLRVIQ